MSLLDSVNLYVPEIISFFAGATIGYLVTINIHKKTATRGGILVDQSNAEAGQDIIGGNKTTLK